MINLKLDEHLLQTIRKHLAGFSVRKNPKEDNTRAAVAVTLVEVADDPGVYGIDYQDLAADQASLVLTRRNSKLSNHAGQWAFPGGRMDKGESPEDAALRELSEEVGLNLSHDAVIGRLDDYTTRSGYVITPVVIWGGPGVDLHPNPEEVRSIHRIPLLELLREDAPWLEKMHDLEHPVLLMPIGDSWIASPTGAIIYQFREVALLGKDTRVAHYEQPFFAWR